MPDDNELVYNGDKVETQSVSDRQSAWKKLFQEHKQPILIAGGVLFILLYSGLAYYLLFAGKTEQTTQTLPLPTATPYPTPTIGVSETPAPTPQPTIDAETVDISGWSTYSSTKYHFSIRYPVRIVLAVNKTAAGIPPYQIFLRYLDNVAPGTLKIAVQDSVFVGQSDVQSKQIMSFGLPDFATAKWTFNKNYGDPNKNGRSVSALVPTTFAEQSAYLFTVSKTYHDDLETTPLDVPYTYIITSHLGYKVIISYPTADPVLQQVANTMQFN